MDSDQRKELVAEAIQKLLEDKRKNNITVSEDSKEEDDENRRFLSNLLSQMESKEAETGSNNEEPEISREDIRKQMKEIQKQNRLTHWLLSGLIVLTLTWQFSEFSLLLNLKKGFTQPLQSVGGMFMGTVNRLRKKAAETENNLSNLDSQFKIPEMPRLDLHNAGPSKDDLHGTSQNSGV